MIQIIDLLEHLNITPKMSGKNVSSGWVEVSCPMPDCSDPSQHCGIHLEKGNFHCWVCGSSGNIIKFIMTALKINYHQAKMTVDKFSDDIIPYSQEITRVSHLTNRNIIPKEATFNLPELHTNYLKKRNFDPIQIQRDYKIMACYTTGNYTYRIIIPIIVNDIVVNFTARDVTNEQDSKYKNCENDHAILKMKEILYNIDSVKDKIIICEGVTDVWRIGKGSIATMGVEYTSAQLSLLAQKELDEIYILFDSDALIKAEKLASAVSTFCNKVEIIELENGDPGDMNPEDVFKLRKEIKI